MKNQFRLLVALSFLFFFTFLNAQNSPTILSGVYTEDITLTKAESPYLVVDSAVFTTYFLRIEPEVIVMFKYYSNPGKKAFIRITGGITTGVGFVGGTPPPAIFTSERDNDPYDLNGDGTASRPMPGDWGYIYLDPGDAVEGDKFMNSVIIRYGGGRQFGNEADPGKYPMVVVSDYNTRDVSNESRYYFLSCTFEHSAGVGVQTAMAWLNECIVRENRYGIRMCTSDGYIENTEISNNAIYPVYLVDPVTKRDGNEDYNQVIEKFYNNLIYGNGLDVIALEGTLSCEYDANNPMDVNPWLFNYQLPYLITDDLFLDSVKLTIYGGTVVKFLPEALAGKPLNIIMNEASSLETAVAEAGKVVFTSLNDHQYDFSPPANTDFKPVPGDWGRIEGYIGPLGNVMIKYGGKYTGGPGRPAVPDSSAVLFYTHPHPEGLTGLLSNVVFYKLYAHGILIDNKSRAGVSVQSSSFFIDQNLYGIKCIHNAEDYYVGANNNYWNGSLGPYHPTLNAKGNGCRVDDYVLFGDYLSVATVDTLLLVPSVIRGAVTDDEGQPVSNALVRLRSKNSKVAYTDPNGEFFISNVKAGSGYELEFLAKAHLDTVIAPLNIPADTSLVFNVSLEAYTIDYAIDKTYFNINPEISTVSVGGQAHRYYRILDINTQQPVYGAEVLVPGLDTFYTNSKGIVDIAIPAAKVGNAYASQTFYIQRIGIETLDFPVDQRETFMVSVFPYAYNKVWSGNTYFKVGIFGFEAKKERGAALDLFVKDEGGGEYADSIRMSRQSRTGFGLNFGASAKVELGSISAGAEAGVGVNLDAIFEDDFRFDYPNSSGRLALAKFIVLADGALPYMDAPLVRYFVACLERQVSEINAAALTNGIGMNLHAYASADAGLDLNLLEGDNATLGAELKGSASMTGDITFMSKLYAHKNTVTDQYPLDLDFDYTGKIDLGVNASIGFDLDKLFGGGEDKKKDESNGAEVKKVDSNLPFPVPDENFGFDLASANASGGISYGLHFGTTRFVPRPWCRMGFMYGYRYNLSAEAMLVGGTGISQDREFRYTFNFYDDQTIDMIMQTADLAKSMLSPDNLINLDISDLSSGKIFNDPMNKVAYQQTRNSFSLAPVVYEKTITDKVDEGGFNIGIDIGVAIVKAKFGAGFSYSEVNNYPVETGLFYNWKLYPMESYDFLEENDAFSAGSILQDIVSTSASYIVSEIKKKLIPPIFRKIHIWPFNKKGEYMIPMGPGSRSSFVWFADSSAVDNIEGIDSLSILYWDWYGTGDDTLSSKSACDPERKGICEYVKGVMTESHKLDYGIGGFYQFEPYNTSVGEYEVYAIINYFDDELDVMLSDSSSYLVDENDLRMYREDKENNRWVFIGGVVDTAANTVKARIDAFGTFTLASFIPSGDIQLTASPDTILLDTTTTCTISSEPVFYNTEVLVADGELFTLKASRGNFVGNDADPQREGFQVAASGGTIQAVYEANALSGTVTILAESLAGEAQGKLEFFIAETEAPSAPVLEGVAMNEESVHLWWDTNPEQDIVRYLVHYDTISGGPYGGTATVFGDPSPVDAGLDTLSDLSGLTEGETYYFAVIAVDRCGNMSAYSNEMSITTSFNHRPVFYQKLIRIDPDLKNGTVIDTLRATDQDPGQTLTFYLPEGQTEDAFAVDPVTGVLTVNNETRLNYFVTRIDTFLIMVGVTDDGTIPYADEGPVMVVLNVETWVPAYRDDRPFLLELYPNPAKDLVTVKLGDPGVSDLIRIDIYDMEGRNCFSERYQNPGQYEIELPVEQLGQGIYHVVLDNGDSRRTGKLIIVR